MTYDEAKERKGVSLVEFYASWCPHCQRMMPIVDEVREIVDNKVAICQFDIDEFPQEAEAAGASSIPTFIVYRDGEERWRHVGEISGDELMQAIRQA